MVKNLTTTCKLIKNDTQVLPNGIFFLILQNFEIFGKSLIQNECITKIANCGWPQKMNFWASKPVKFKFLATKPVFSFVFTKIEFSDHHNLEMSDDVMLWNFFLMVFQNSFETLWIRRHEDVRWGAPDEDGRDGKDVDVLRWPAQMKVERERTCTLKW